jgi:hypothetical protein
VLGLTFDFFLMVGHPPGKNHKDIKKLVLTVGFLPHGYQRLQPSTGSQYQHGLILAGHWLP